MGELKASSSCCRSEQRGNKPYRQETRRCHLRKICFCKAIDTLFKACWAKGKKLRSLVNVRYLYQPGELEGGVKRATDPIWYLKVYSIERSFTKPNQPVLYYLFEGPKRGFVREELLVVPPNTQLPPEQL